MKSALGRRRKLRTRVTLLFLIFASVPPLVVAAVGRVFLDSLLKEEIASRTTETRDSAELLINLAQEKVRRGVDVFAERVTTLIPENIEELADEDIQDWLANNPGLDLLAVVALGDGKPTIKASAHCSAALDKEAPLFARAAPLATATVGYAQDLTAGNPPRAVPAILGVRAVADAQGRARFVVYGGMLLDTYLASIAETARTQLELTSPHLDTLTFPPAETFDPSEDDTRLVLRALPGGRAKLSWVTPDRAETREPAEPTVVHFHVKNERLEEARSTVTRSAIGLSLASLLLALIAGALISRPIAGPITELAGAAQKIAAGNLDVRIEPSSNDEVGALVDVFNHMTAELEESRVRLQRAERIAAWREIARRVAHEIKNPLFPIQMSMETLRKSFRTQHPALGEIVEESTRTVLEEVRALNRIVTEFSDFARLPAPKSGPVSALDLLDHPFGLYQEVATEAGARVTVTLDRPAIDARGLPKVIADREQIGRALINLVKNAIEAMPAGGGRIVLDAVAETRGARPGVTLTVADSGLGMPEEVRRQIFTPYFTTKSQGTGLGLAIVDRIVQEHQGAIDVESTAGAGTTIRLWLPAAPAGSEQTATS